MDHRLTNKEVFDLENNYSKLNFMIDIALSLLEKDDAHQKTVNIIRNNLERMGKEDFDDTP